MQVIEISTVEDLKDVYDFLKSQGAADDTPLFFSHDAEGNRFDAGAHIGFDAGINFEVYPYGSQNYVTENGSVICYPSDIQTEMLWEE